MELSTDLSVSEDAHFAITVKNPTGAEQDEEQVYICVADGVGSWRQFGIDPRLYAHK